MIKHTKIDIIRNMKSFYLLLLPIIVMIITGLRGNGSKDLFWIGYFIFFALVFSTMPFHQEKREEKGFLSMLPSRPGDDIRGHYIYGLLLILASGLVAIVCLLLVPKILSNNINETLPKIVLLFIGLAILMLGIQNLLLTVFRYASATAMVFLRLFPGFILLMLISIIPTDAPNDASLDADGAAMNSASLGVFSAESISWTMSIAVLAVGIAVFFILMQIAANMSRRQG